MLDRPELRFISDANDFEYTNKHRLFFKILKFIMRCNDTELSYLIRKVYCDSFSNRDKPSENALKSYLGILISPFSVPLIKKIWWKSNGQADYNIETIDLTYFDQRLAKTCEKLFGSKRITPRYLTSEKRSGYIITEPYTASISMRTVIRLWLVMPLVALPLYWFCWTSGINILKEYRTAVMQYLLFDGYFKRYPCKNYITYADDTNHPSRYIAFKQNCSGNLIVIQNGERTYRPSWAFGMVDIYFVFGEFYQKLIRQMGYQVDKIYPVGATLLDYHYKRLSSRNHECLYNILYIDNGSICGPDYGGLPEEVAKSEEIVFKNLAKFIANNSHLRCAYQLRVYDANSDERSNILKKLNSFFGESIEILNNSGKGESYENILKADLVIGFQSTMGFEALIMGRKALFINYSQCSSETVCDDDTYQIDSKNQSYDYFEQKIKMLLSRKNDDIPLVAVNKQYAFDGKVCIRTSDILNETMDGANDT